MEICEHCGEVHAFKGFVYRQTNTSNGKWYIGSHFGCPDDGYLGSGVAFLRALRKYGPQSFEREIIFHSTGSRSDLHASEEQILKACRARQDRNSYNMKNKGMGQDPEVTRLINLGKKIPREQIARQQASLLMSGKIAGVNNPRAQEVVNLRTEEKFAYGRLAAQSVDGTDPGISEACHKGNKHREDYWMFVVDWEELERPDVHPFAKKANWRVVRLSDGEVFESASAAAREHGITARTIGLALDFETKSAAQHHWMRYRTWVLEGRPVRQFSPFRRAIDRVVDVTTGTNYRTCAECADAVEMTEENVRASCKGKHRTRRFMWYGDWMKAGCPQIEFEKLEAQYINRSRIVRIKDTLDPSAEWIEFPSQLAAATYISKARFENTNSAGVSRAADGRVVYRGFTIERIS